MSGDRLTPELRAVVNRVCTEREIEAVRLSDRGIGQRTIALRLGCSRAVVRNLLDSASRKVRAALEGDHL